MDKKLLKIIKENAQKLVELQQAVDEAFLKKDKNLEAYDHACRDFKKLQDTLSFPGGLEYSMNLLKNGDPAVIDAAITFLSADPLFFRSGYIKQKILMYLKKVPLSQKQVEELQEILIHQIDIHGRREFRDYCKLADKIADESFITRIKEKLLSENKDTQRQAQWMLDAIKDRL